MKAFQPIKSQAVPIISFLEDPVQGDHFSEKSGKPVIIRDLTVVIEKFGNL